jgi:hypothetical protein
VSEPRPSFQLDPVTLNKHEVVASYRALATRYRRMAEAEERPLTRDALLDLARQCDVAAEQMGSSGRASRN